MAEGAMDTEETGLEESADHDETDHSDMDCGVEKACAEAKKFREGATLGTVTKPLALTATSIWRTAVKAAHGGSVPGAPSGRHGRGPTSPGRCG